jgi:hypothetical protein
MDAITKLKPKSIFYGDCKVTGVSVGTVNDDKYCTSSEDKFLRVYDERSGRTPTLKVHTKMKFSNIRLMRTRVEYLVLIGIK